MKISQFLLTRQSSCPNMADITDLASWTLTACFILICINREDRHEYLDNHRCHDGYSMSGEARSGVTLLIICVH